MFNLLLVIMLIVVLCYVVMLHSKNSQLQYNYHNTLKLDHDWMLFENRILGPAIVSRIDNLIRATDLRHLKKGSPLVNYLVDHVIDAGFVTKNTTVFDYKEAGYDLVRDSGGCGLSGAKIVLYRTQNDPGFVVACYEDFELKWFFHTTDIPYAVVRLKNKFMEDLYYNWLKYTTEKHFLAYMAKTIDIKNAKHATRQK